MRKLPHLLLTSLLSIALLVPGISTAKNDKHHKSHKDVPKGIEKKARKTGELPPGWEKKLTKGSILDIDLYRYGKRRPWGKDDRYELIDIDNETVRVLRNTREIVEILN